MEPAAPVTMTVFPASSSRTASRSTATASLPSRSSSFTSRISAINTSPTITPVKCGTKDSCQQRQGMRPDRKNRGGQQPFKKIDGAGKAGKVQCTAKQRKKAQAGRRNALDDLHQVFGANVTPPTAQQAEAPDG